MSALDAGVCTTGATDAARLAVSLAAACDISLLSVELIKCIVSLRAGVDVDSIGALIEVIAERIKVLSGGIVSALDDPADTTSDIRRRLYPGQARDASPVVGGVQA